MSFWQSEHEWRQRQTNRTLPPSSQPAHIPAAAVSQYQQLQRVRQQSYAVASLPPRSFAPHHHLPLPHHPAIMARQDHRFLLHAPQQPLMNLFPPQPPPYTLAISSHLPQRLLQHQQLPPVVSRGDQESAAQALLHFSQQSDPKATDTSTQQVKEVVSIPDKAVAAKSHGTKRPLEEVEVEDDTSSAENTSAKKHKKDSTPLTSKEADPLTQWYHNLKSSGTITSWDVRFMELREYKKKYGSCRVATNQAGRYRQLGVWVSYQRTSYSLYQKAKEAGKPKKPCEAGMSEERIALLEQIGFEWNVGNGTWDTRYEELKAYKNLHGTCNVPRVKEGPLKALSTWVRHQRTAYSSFMRAKEEGLPTDKNCKGMTEERIERLVKLDFEWYVPQDKIGWHMRFEELKAYKKKHGTCRVPKSGTVRQLATWVSHQRQSYAAYMEAKQSGKPTTSYSKLTEERIARLEEIGFEWTLQSTSSKKKRVKHS